MMKWRQCDKLSKVVGMRPAYAIETKKWQDISLYIFGYHNLFASLYSTSILFFSSYKVGDVSIPLYSDQTWGTLILCESKSWLDRSARDHVGFRFLYRSVV